MNGVVRPVRSTRERTTGSVGIAAIVGPGRQDADDRLGPGQHRLAGALGPDAVDEHDADRRRVGRRWRPGRGSGSARRRAGAGGRWRPGAIGGGGAARTRGRCHRPVRPAAVGGRRAAGRRRLLRAGRRRAAPPGPARSGWAGRGSSPGHGSALASTGVRRVLTGRPSVPRRNARPLPATWSRRSTSSVATTSGSVARRPPRTIATPRLGGARDGDRLDDRVEAPGIGGRDGQQPRLVACQEADQVAGRDVRAQVGHGPALLRQDVAQADQAEHVLLPGDPGQDRQRPDPPLGPDLRPDAVQDPQEGLAGEVLLGDAPATLGPALADQAHRVGQQTVVDRHSIGVERGPAPGPRWPGRRRHPPATTPAARA